MAVGINNVLVYISCYIGAFGITLQPSPIASCQRHNSLILTCSISGDWNFVAFNLQTPMGTENIAAFTDAGGSCKDNAAPTPGLYETSCDYNSKTFYLTIKNITDIYNGKFIECMHYPVNRKAATTINVQYVPTSFPSITQLPNRPIIEGSKLTLTCKISGGNPLATIVWQCTGFSTVTSTGTPPTDEVVSSVEHVVTKDDNGKECVCTGKHLLWTIDQLERHTLDVYYQPALFPFILQTPQGPVNNGDSIVLTCSIQGGNPLAVITWQCGGYVPVTPTGSPSATTTVSNVQLTVNINHNDAVCTCIGTHPAWNQSKRTGVILDVRYAPVSSPKIIQMPTGPINEGDTVTLTCKISIGNPLATIVWQCSGFDVITPTIMPPTDESVSMIRRVVTKDDNGKECVCLGKQLLWDDDKETRHTLDVYYKPTVLPLITQTPPGTVNDSDRIVLSCEIQGGNPLAVITWECGGSIPITPSGSTKPETAVSNVQFTASKDQNGNVCSCKGFHPVWDHNKTADVTLDVRYAPQSPPSIIKTPEGQIVEGNNVTLTCKIFGGNPLATIVWQCGGFEAVNHESTLSTDEVMSTLTKVATKHDNGKECVCTGKHLLWLHDMKHTYSLTVYYSTSTHIANVQPINVVQNNSIILICEEKDGNPKNASFQWYKGNLFIAGTSKFTITEAQAKDTGNYTCRGSNGFGEDSAKVEVYVSFAPKICLLQVLKSNTVDEHQSVTFQCEVDSYPAPDIAWLFNKTKTLLKNDVHVFKSNYTIPKTNCLQTGSYRCQASNVIDAMVVNSFSETYLFVLCSVRTDQRYKETLEDISIFESDDLNITVYLLAYPLPLISWTVKNHATGIISPVTCNNSFNVFEHISTVYISKMSKTDYGVYTVQAFNNIGLKYIRSFTVIPQGPPNQPTDILVACEITSMLISWQPGFNGGIEQTFRVAWLNLKTQHTKFSSVIPDYHQGQSKQFIVKSLDPDTMYIIYVEASNKHGIVRSRKNANCTTDASSHNSQIHGSLAISIGAGIGSSVLILTIAALVVFVLKRRTNNKEGFKKACTKSSKSDEYSDLQTSNPAFQDPYTSIHNTNESRHHQESSANTYEECGNISDAAAYQNLENMKYGHKTEEKNMGIYDNMKI